MLINLYKININLINKCKFVLWIYVSDELDGAMLLYQKIPTCLKSIW